MKQFGKGLLVRGYAAWPRPQGILGVELNGVTTTLFCSECSVNALPKKGNVQYWQ